MTKKLTIRKPDDWHLHLRDGAMLKGVLPESARHFARALVMPNLAAPVVTAKDAAAYRGRIIDARPDGSAFTPLMTLYLTERTDPADVEAAHRAGLVHAVKLYPAGATTNSQSGVGDIDRVMPVLEKMADIGMPLCVHGEVTDPDVDIFDREAVFIERVLAPLCRRLPQLRIVLEHITTRNGVDFVRDGGDRIGATITTHHLVINRNDLLAGGIKPHYYCLPVAKREAHRLALIEAATSPNAIGAGRFFLGTDSAPHPDPAKQSACGCAGCFTASNTLSILATVFERADALSRLEAFTSLNGAAFYGLPANESRLTLTKGAALTPATKIETGAGAVTVFDPGFPLVWGVENA